VGQLALEQPEVRAACSDAKVTSAVSALEGKGGAAQMIVHLQKIWAQVEQSKKREAATSSASPKRRKVGQA
jgi:head-tail adaptor